MGDVKRENMKKGIGLSATCPLSSSLVAHQRGSDNQMIMKADGERSLKALRDAVAPCLLFWKSRHEEKVSLTACPNKQPKS